MRVAKVITLSDEERTTLVRWSRGRSTPARLVLRAKIVLAAAEGRENKDISADLGCTRRTVLDLRSIKSTMQMDVLRCKTPELVHKEVWTHILAYNLIRTIMAQAAIRQAIEPRTISFKGALQTLEAFQPLIDFQGHRGPAFRVVLYQQLLESIALHRVADRPGRFEPRYRKRRSKRYAEMKLPRQQLKQAMLNGLIKI
ncbi:MAG: helix-turn-helix domain-containing protein [Planctomycetaceae bacterium]|nr:helix-turn-helix domain-containing protein [Planctomycetaceae bacterium]